MSSVCVNDFTKGRLIRIFTEVSAAAISAFNFLEGGYALKYPRPPLPPYTSPAKTKPIFKNDPTPKRPFKVLSPNVNIHFPPPSPPFLTGVSQTSPQPQKPFASSRQSSSFSTSIAGGSTYPTSPLSTPSRVLHYPDIVLTNTQGSSTSTMTFQTPSPVLSAYRGKHANGMGRKFFSLSLFFYLRTANFFSQVR